MDAIIQETKDFSPVQVKKFLYKMVDEENIISLVTRAGLPSYRINKDTIPNEEVLEQTFRLENEQNNEEHKHQNSLLEQEILQTEKFEIMKEFIRTVSDLKEFVAYEIDKMRNNVAKELVERYKEENEYLKNEILESRNLLRDVLINFNTNRPPVTVNRNENNNNEWKTISKGPSRAIPRHENYIEVSNRYDAVAVRKCHEKFRDIFCTRQFCFSPLATFNVRDF